MYGIEKKRYVVWGDLNTLNGFNETLKEKIKSDDCIFTKDIQIVRSCTAINSKLKIISSKGEGE